MNGFQWQQINGPSTDQLNSTVKGRNGGRNKQAVHWDSIDDEGDVPQVFVIDKSTHVIEEGWGRDDDGLESEFVEVVEDYLTIVTCRASEASASC